MVEIEKVTCLSKWQSYRTKTALDHCDLAGYTANLKAVEYVDFSGADQGQPGRGAEYLANDFCVGIGYGQETLYDVSRGMETREALTAMKEREGGYSLEVTLPFSFLNGLTPEVNKEVGFDLALDDADASDERETQMIWSGTAALPDEVREMGVALLDGTRTVPHPTVAPSPTRSIRVLFPLIWQP